MKIVILSILLFSATNMCYAVSLKNNENFSVESKICFPSKNKKIMQSFFYNYDKGQISLTFDNAKRTKQTVESYENDVLVSKQNYKGNDSIGHLDGIYLRDDIIYATDKYTNPSIVALKNNKIIQRLNYPIELEGDQILAIQPTEPSSFFLWATDKDKKKKFFYGEIDYNLNKINSMKTTNINFPQTKVMQGFAVSKSSIFALTGEPNSEINLYEWDKTSSELLADNTIDLSNLSLPKNYRFEPEGINVVNNNNNQEVYIGLAIIDEKNDFSNCILKLTK